MIIVELKGGLGNQLFQYAAAKTVADANDLELYCDIQHFQNVRAWNLEINKLLQLQFKRKPDDCYSFVEDGFHFQPIKIAKDDRATFLSGYFQSYKYHANVKNDLQSLICDLNLSDDLRTVCSKISAMKTLGVHIRRGDYLNPHALSYHGIIPNERYATKINEINERENYDVVVAFSDSMDALVEVEKQINLPMLKVSSFGLTNIEEMQIMTRVDDIIIANSSFSWWGAYLNINDKTHVYRPADWFNKQEIECKDLCPPEWLVY